MNAALATAVLQRAGQTCECGCGLTFDSSLSGTRTIDHMFSRKVPDSEDTLWVLRNDHHRQKTDSVPDAETWFRKFLVHAERHGFRASYERALKELSWREQKKAFGKGAA